MATEEFKELTEQLFENYYSLHQKVREKANKDIHLDFKEYLDLYLKYMDLGLDGQNDFDYEDDEDLEPSEDNEE